MDFLDERRIGIERGLELHDLVEERIRIRLERSAKQRSAHAVRLAIHQPEIVHQRNAAAERREYPQRASPVRSVQRGVGQSVLLQRGSLQSVLLPHTSIQRVRKHHAALGSRHSLHKPGNWELNTLTNERRADGAGLEEVGMIADLSELHQHAHHREKRPASQLLARVAPPDVVLVEEPLALAQRTGHDVEVFLGHLDFKPRATPHFLLHFALQSAENKRTQHLVQTVHQPRVHAPLAFHHLIHWVAEPEREFPAASEERGHQEMHQRPQLHQTVLQRRSGEQKPPLCVEMKEDLPAFGLEILDVVRLVQHHVHPLLATKHRHVAHSELIRGDAHLKPAALRPAFSLFLQKNNRFAITWRSLAVP